MPINNGKLQGGDAARRLEHQWHHLLDGIAVEGAEGCEILDEAAFRFWLVADHSSVMVSVAEVGFWCDPRILV